MAILHIGTVTSVLSGKVYVSTPNIGAGIPFGPVESPGFNLSPGDRVVLGQIGKIPENLMVVSVIDLDQSTLGTVWYTGIVDPDDLAGKDNDFYLNTETFELWTKIDGIWTLLGIIKGTTWFHGSGVPDDSDGADGDYYVDEDNSDVYQKISGSWVFQFTLIGANTVDWDDITDVPTLIQDIDDLDANDALNYFLPAQSGENGKFLKTDGTDVEWDNIPGGGDALTSNPLSQFAATTSAELAGVITNETGTGALVFGTAPNITSPTGIVKGDVGLGNVDDTSDATKDAAAVTLTNKSLDAGTLLITDTADPTKAAKLIVSGISSGTTRTYTFPNGGMTFVGTSIVQTLSNKTLTLPVISSISNSGTLTLPTGTDTIVARATTDTLTNKTINGPDNTLTNIAQSSVTNLVTDLAAKKTDSMATNKLLGRGTAGTGVIEEITLGTGLSLTGTTLNASSGVGTTNLSRTLTATTVVVESDTGTDATIPAADGTNAGVMTSAMQVKLAGIATGATANSSDAFLLARANHTGNQTMSTISDAGTLATLSTVTLTSNVTGILPGANGGTANGFMAFSGPSASLKTFILPNASSTILTSNAVVTVSQGGTGRATGTTAYGIVAVGTTATGAQQTISPGTSGQILKSNGAAALATFQTGAPGDVALGNVDNTSDATKNAAAVTLTNKTVALGSNTITGTTAQFNTALTDNDFATLAGTETLTNKTLTTPVINSPTGITKSDVGLSNVTNNAQYYAGGTDVAVADGGTGASTANAGFNALAPTQTGNSGKFLKTDGTNTSWDVIAGGGDALTTNPLSQFAPTTSLQLKGVISDETGSGALVFGTAPNITSPTGIVKGDVGLGNVDNTSNATERAAVATLTNKTLTSPVINTPTGIVKGDVGLGNVDNTSDATKNAAAVTLTNKTLTAPVISTISNTGTLTLPTSTDTLVGRDTTDTLTNKTLTSPVINTPTGIVKADVGLGNVDNTSNATERAATATLTNKTLTAPVINSPTGITKGDVGLGNVDNTSDATKNAAAVTLTNKTLTAPVINSPTGIVKADVGLSNVPNTDATARANHTGNQLASTISDFSAAADLRIQAAADSVLQGMLATSFDAAAIGGTSLPTAGSVYVTKIKLDAPQTITNIILNIETAGATLTTNQCWAAIYDSAGARQGLTATQHLNWQTTGVKTIALTSTYAAPAGFYWIAVVSNGSTQPAFCRSVAATNSTRVNAGLTAATSRAGIAATSQTTMPASFTPSGINQTAHHFWAGVS